MDENLLYKIPFGGCILDVSCPLHKVWSSDGFVRYTIIEVDAKSPRTIREIMDHIIQKYKTANIDVSIDVISPIKLSAKDELGAPEYGLPLDKPKNLDFNKSCFHLVRFTFSRLKSKIAKREKLLWKIPFDGNIKDVHCPIYPTWSSVGPVRHTILEIDKNVGRTEKQIVDNIVQNYKDHDINVEIKLITTIIPSLHDELGAPEYGIPEDLAEEYKFKNAELYLARFVFEVGGE